VELTRTDVSRLPPSASTANGSASLIKALATERFALRSSELINMDRRLAGGPPLECKGVDAPSRRTDCRRRDVYVKPSRPCAAGELGVEDGKPALSTAACELEFKCSRGAVSSAPLPPPPSFGGFLEKVDGAARC
jgi:hypothetical protein